MRKFVFALAILAGVAAPIASTYAGTMCTTQTFGGRTFTYCS